MRIRTGGCKKVVDKGVRVKWAAGAKPIKYIPGAMLKNISSGNNQSMYMFYFEKYESTI